MPHGPGLWIVLLLGQFHAKTLPAAGLAGHGLTAAAPCGRALPLCLPRPAPQHRHGAPRANPTAGFHQPSSAPGAGAALGTPTDRAGKHRLPALPALGRRRPGAGPGYLRERLPEAAALRGRRS